MVKRVWVPVGFMLLIVGCANLRKLNQQMSAEPAGKTVEESAAERDRIKSLRDDLQAGHIGPDALGEDDYQQVIRPDSAGDAQVTCGASILGILVALAAGIVVALITWDAALSLLVAIGGSIAGTTATLALPAIYHAIDTEWLRLEDWPSDRL